MRAAIRQQLLQQKKQEEMRKWVDDTSQSFEEKTTYQVGYAPPAETTTGATPPRGSGLSLADALLELQELTERLRRDCPWDREQTARTIVPHTVEEAYEVADAALADRPDKLLDELGDLLFQVYFLALLLQEQGEGDLEQAARGIQAKLIARHPHVFGDAEARTAERVRERWEQLKAARRRGGRESSTTSQRRSRASAGAQGAAARRRRWVRVPRRRGSARRPAQRARRAGG